MDNAGIDILLVGDSVAMVVHGHDTTLPVTLDDMLVHCKAVSRGARRWEIQKDGLITRISPMTIPNMTVGACSIYLCLGVSQNT